MFMGSSSDGGLNGMNNIEQMVGRNLQTHRSFTSGDLPATYNQTGACSMDPAQGWRSAYSFVAADNTRLGQIASGAYDNRIANWVKSVPKGQSVGFSFCHEANAKLDSSSLANQINAFQRAGSVFDQMRSDGVQQVTSGNVYLVLCLTNSNFNNQGSSILNRYNPAIEAVDALALDIYGGSAGDNRNFPNWSKDFFTWWNSTGHTVGTGRWGIWETSASDVKGSIALKSTYIEEGIRISFQNDAEFFHAFDSGQNGSQPYFNRQIYADLFREGMDLYADSNPPPPPPPPPPVCPAGTDRAGQVIPTGETAAWCDIVDPPPPPPPNPVYAPRDGVFQFIRLG